MIRLVIFDLDGTLYRGDQAIPGAVEAVEKLLSSGVAVRYLTNNSGHTQKQISGKLSSLGFPCEEAMVYGTGRAAAEYCREQKYKNPLIIGEPGLQETFTEFVWSPLPDQPHDVVVAGICRTFSYDLCDQALQAIRAGAAFVATNRDATYPLEKGREQPGAGAIVASIEAASGETPIVLGKPSPRMIQSILRETRCQPQECLVIGDRVETDVDAGKAAGCHVLLVLTGATAVAPPKVPSISTLRDLNLADFGA